jgi:predicted Zn-dependent protease
MQKALLALILIISSTEALAQSNDLIGKQNVGSKKLYIHSSIPSGCQYTITRAAATWNAVTTKAQLVWTNYIATRAYAYNTTTKKNTSTISNTFDVQFESGTLDDLNALAQTFYRVGTSSTNLTDGDVIANIDKLPILYCNPDATKIPMTQVDFEYVMLHEIGHVWGLGHDTVNTDAVVAPPKYWGPQSAKRTLTTNDSGRLKFQYGP